MALGGGTYLTQNKKVSGAYINFVSATKASAEISDRGVAALALELNWGASGVQEIEAADFQKNSLKLFGYSYDADEMQGLRELFLHCNKAYLYRLNEGAKATNQFAKAKYSGVRGNSLKIVIASSVDYEGQYEVSTYLDTQKVDVQTVANATDLVANDYVEFVTTATLANTAGMALSGGTNAESVTGTQYQAFLDEMEGYSFNTLGCLSTEATIIQLFVQFTKRMRDEVGAKFQTVVYRTTADYEGVISCYDSKDLIYWLVGAEAGCQVNRTLTNATYDGELTIKPTLKQSTLVNLMEAGHIVMHKVGDEVRVFEDRNTFTSTSIYKNEDFTDNQVMRVLDQLANDVAVLFANRHLGKTQNNVSGRIAFWNDLDTYFKQLQGLEAIENYTSADIIVKEGTGKKDVVVSMAVDPVCAMTKLYIDVVIN